MSGKEEKEALEFFYSHSISEQVRLMILFKLAGWKIELWEKGNHGATLSPTKSGGGDGLKFPKGMAKAQVTGEGGV